MSDLAARTGLLILGGHFGFAHRYDDPIVPGASLLPALRHVRANPHLMLALTSAGGHLGWCERGEGVWGGSGWVERAVTGFLEAALGVDMPTEGCETAGCEVFD
jgi:hypothetical protein